MKYHILPNNNAGSIEHYYHFLFGYLFPFIQNVNNNKRDIYYFDDCGPMNRHILNLPLYNTKIIDPTIKIEKTLQYRGYDLFYNSINLKIIKQIIFSIHNIDPLLSGEEIILIDRDKPDNFYLTKAKIKGSGSSRRHIPNIDDILVYLQNKIPTIKKVYLENMSLKDQVILFKTSKIIICQHGASMSNLIWCNPNTTVVEIRTRRNDRCFNFLSQRCNLVHKKILQSHKYQAVDPKLIYETIII